MEDHHSISCERTREWGAVINARIDYIVKVEAENILKKEGITPSQAIERFYRKIIEDGKFEPRFFEYR